mmetsp:Transcript_23839/g.39295  ORF Transcript_23839/g.39295 Transcript_23839/m.39295 type:complete len:92 (-) Transcript_23839:70-345(-)
MKSILVDFFIQFPSMFSVPSNIPLLSSSSSEFLIVVEQKGRILSSMRCEDDGTDVIGAKEETAPIRRRATVVASLRDIMNRNGSDMQDGII